MALIATETDINTATVYELLNNTTPVSIIGSDADISALDYLTQGEQEIDGYETGNSFKQEITTAEQIEPQVTDELDKTFGYEMVQEMVAESTTLYPRETSIHPHVNFGETETETRVGLYDRSGSVSRQVLQDIERNIAKEEGNFHVMRETEEPERGFDPKCNKGALTCAGAFRASGKKDGNTWSKDVVAGYIQVDNEDDWWAIRTRVRMTPNRSPRFRKYVNDHIERTIEMSGVGEIDESEPSANGDVENHSYSMGVGSDGTSSAEWTETIAEAPMTIEWMEYTDSVEHSFDSFADYNEKHTVAVEPMYKIRTLGFLPYDYEDEIQWSRMYSTQNPDTDMSGMGWWLMDE